MPTCFMANYPATCIISDYTVNYRNAFISCSVADVLIVQEPQLGLVDIAPNEIVTFISCLYGGHISDKKITRVCLY